MNLSLYLAKYLFLKEGIKEGIKAGIKATLKILLKNTFSVPKRINERSQNIFGIIFGLSGCNPKSTL